MQIVLQKWIGKVKTPGKIQRQQLAKTMRQENGADENPFASRPAQLACAAGVKVECRANVV